MVTMRVEVKQIWNKMISVFSRKQKIRLFFLSCILVFDTIFELLGIISVYPFIALVLDPDMINTNTLINYVYEKMGRPEHRIFFLVVAVFIILLYVIKNIYNGLAQYLRYGFIFDTKRELGVKLMRDYMKEPYSFFLEKNSSVLMRGVSTDVSQFFDLIFNGLYILSDGLMMIIFGITLVCIDWQLSISIFGVIILFVFLFIKRNKKRSSFYGLQTQKNSSLMTQWLQQAFGGAKEIKILRREDYFVKNYELYCAETNKMNQKFLFINALPHLVLEAFCSTVILTVIATRVYKGIPAISFVPNMSVYAMALFRLFPRVSRINASINSVIFCYPYLESVYQDVQMAKEHKYARNKRREVGIKESSLSFASEVRLENIHFSYPNTNIEVINGVNLTLKKGEAIGLVGQSGAGKTTLADCFLGILELSSGRVTCDGKDIQNHIDEWADKLGYIPQSIFLSDDTIRNNVAFGLTVDESSDDQVWMALEQAQLKEFVASLPEGLDTKIGERGVRLSGGQRQRIGIARALYTNPDILVLDEATSALDNETETAVMESIEHLLGHKTMIIIAHRITTVRNCDTIYIVDNGGVTQVTYDDLKQQVN